MDCCEFKKGDIVQLKENPNLTRRVDKVVNDTINITNGIKTDISLAKDWQLVKYPVFKKYKSSVKYPFFKKYKSSELILVKFTDIKSGLILNNSRDWNAGDKSDELIPHISDDWGYCTFDEVPDIFDIDWWDARFASGKAVGYVNNVGVNCLLTRTNSDKKPSDFIFGHSKGSYKFYIPDTGKVKSILEDDIAQSVLNLIKEKLEIKISMVTGTPFADELKVSLMIDNEEFKNSSITLNDLWHNFDKE